MIKIRTLLFGEAIEGEKPLAALKRRFFPIFTILFLLFATLFTGYRFFKNSVSTTQKVISEDVSIIVSALKSIDETCNILSIKSDRNKIDFLVVKSFAGSEIGSLNLAHPDQWQGPYVDSNPTINGVLYDLVRTRDGYYVVPGDGVTLPSGLQVGVDVIIDSNADVSSMISTGGALNHKGVSLGSKLDFIIGDWDFSPQGASDYKQAGEDLREFSEAMSYTKNDKVLSQA